MLYDDYPSSLRATFKKKKKKIVPVFEIFICIQM